MNALRSAPLVPVKPKQRTMLGEARARESIDAQLRARGLAAEPEASEVINTPFHCWTPHHYGDRTLSASAWEARACQECNAGCLACGNHTCRADVCHKGRFAKSGFCRMLFWHWRRCVNPKGKSVVRRVHGRDLVSRWDGAGLPPVHSVPPQIGLPALEQNHAYHFKMTPGVMLGPRCNHDLGVLLRLPVMPPEFPSKAEEVDTQYTHITYPPALPQSGISLIGMLCCSMQTNSN